MVSTAAVAEIGSLLGDPARVNMMVALLDGRAWTARELADAAGVSPQTASSHLGKLVAAELVKLDRQGRHHYHRLASSETARLLEQMHLAGAAARRSRVSGPKDLQMRELRSCYDHLAGRIAVEISDRILDENDSVAGAAQLSPEGVSLLKRIGIELDQLRSGRRAVCRVCLDWSERRPHVAGAVGAAILSRLKILGWVKTRPSGRSLILTAAGERGVGEVFGIQSIRS
ncbi:MAG TPA: winged helix-turn-helix domain-containing protein [Sphingomicrobium sp.]|jgi:DNA-binding transcriptional ArsR family regulator|nr:winged helix-turn-helix domain-containing protein [Sphingomicrobium sp.]